MSIMIKFISEGLKKKVRFEEYRVDEDLTKSDDS